MRYTLKYYQQHASCIYNFGIHLSCDLNCGWIKRKSQTNEKRELHRMNNALDFYMMGQSHNTTVPHKVHTVLSRDRD